MTSGKSYWWTRKSVEGILTATVVVWIGVLIADVILTANTPVRGRLLASVLVGAIVATVMFFSQLRKRKTPSKPQVQMPPWVPPMQTWYMGGILLLLAYLQILTYGNAVGTTWASTWLRFTVPFSDLVAWAVPPLDAYSDSLETHGYKDRVATVRHAQAVSWVWLFLVNGYLIFWITQRWNFTKDHVKDKSMGKIIFVTFLFSIMFYLFFLLSTDTHIIYENEPHSLYDLLHYSDSSLILNCVLFPLILYLFFTMLLIVAILIPARISNIRRSQDSQ
jgi:hypothetical protein